MISDSKPTTETEVISALRVERKQGRSGPGKWHYFDLIFLNLLGLGMLALVQVDLPLLRLPIGLALVFLIPGYVIMVAFFPHSADIDGTARLALSIGLSIVVVAALALLLSFLPWGLHLWPVVVSLNIWNVVVSVIGLVRRYIGRGRERETEREGFATGLGPWWRAATWQVRTVLVVSAIITGLILVYCLNVLTTPDPAAQLTEFYVLNPSGLVEDYPRQAAPGQPIQVKLGVANREGQSENYRIEIRSAGETLRKIGPLQLADSKVWEQSVEFSLTQAGKDQIIEIYLFNSDSSQPYRQLRLWVDVEAGQSQVKVLFRVRVTRTEVKDL